jgi:hypothetical protein
VSSVLFAVCAGGTRHRLRAAAPDPNQKPVRLFASRPKLSVLYCQLQKSPVLKTTRHRLLINLISGWIRVKSPL